MSRWSPSALEPLHEVLWIARERPQPSCGNVQQQAIRLARIGGSHVPFIASIEHHDADPPIGRCESEEVQRDQPPRQTCANDSDPNHASPWSLGFITHVRRRERAGYLVWQELCIKNPDISLRVPQNNVDGKTIPCVSRERHCSGHCANSPVLAPIMGPIPAYLFADLRSRGLSLGRTRPTFQWRPVT